MGRGTKEQGMQPPNERHPGVPGGRSAWGAPGHSSETQNEPAYIGSCALPTLRGGCEHPNGSEVLCRKSLTGPRVVTSCSTVPQEEMKATSGKGSKRLPMGVQPCVHPAGEQAASLPALAECWEDSPLGGRLLPAQTGGEGSISMGDQKPGWQNRLCGAPSQPTSQSNSRTTDHSPDMEKQHGILNPAQVP